MTLPEIWEQVHCIHLFLSTVQLLLVLKCGLNRKFKDLPITRLLQIFEIQVTSHTILYQPHNCGGTPQPAQCLSSNMTLFLGEINNTLLSCPDMEPHCNSIIYILSYIPSEEQPSLPALILISGVICIVQCFSI